ncbi:tyrosine-type recombinase/integrase [Deinococcus radiomollis]|uniref:tyrosine-type recombinase/integrase n=1 Tax=Deinococcus radiomollis TaxID=468916 RepID=UPI003891870A
MNVVMFSVIICLYIMIKAKKNPHNQGSFRQRPSGKWEGSRWVNSIGKRVSVTAATQPKARLALEAKILEIGKNDSTGRTSKETFKVYAKQIISQREGLGDRTRDKYRDDLRLYLIPLHQVRLDKITPALLRYTYAGLRESGLSDAVRGHAHTLARLVLETARTDGLISRNPADVKSIRPKPERGSEDSQVQAYTPSQVAQLVRAAPGITHSETVLFLLRTGMRRGEMMGLRWSAIDRRTGTAGVRITRSTTQPTSGGKAVYEGKPKTKQSNRDVPLSADVLQLLDALQVLTKERRAQLYPDKDLSPYVFPSLCGTPQRPDNVRRVLHTILDEADRQALAREEKRAAALGVPPEPVEPLPRYSVHALRHTFVSLMAAQGVRLEVIAAWIGDRPETVMKVYLHIFKTDLPMPTLDLPDLNDG